jgi:hypothetical protein
MKHLAAFCLSVLVGAAPAVAQDSDLSEGMTMLEKGSRLILEGLMKEMGPMLLELEGKIVDLNAYDFPEVLPNGDIIIRRKAPLVPELKDGEIEL